MANVKNGASDGTSILGAVLLIFLAYIAGRWQINKAGDIIDKQFNDHPRAVAGATTLAGAIFSNEILGGHPLPAVMAGAGLLLIGQDVLYSLGDKDLQDSIDITPAEADLSGHSPVITT